MWTCETCKESREGQFCWSCGTARHDGSVAVSEVALDRAQVRFLTATGTGNKVVKVGLRGGLISLFSDNPQMALNKTVMRKNADGRQVVQVIPDDSGNILTMLFRLVVLLVTLFLYTPANGYFLIMESR